MGRVILPKKMDPPEIFFKRIKAAKDRMTPNIGGILRKLLSKNQVIRMDIPKKDKIPKMINCSGMNNAVIMDRAKPHRKMMMEWQPLFR